MAHSIGARALCVVVIIASLLDVTAALRHRAPPQQKKAAAAPANKPPQAGAKPPQAGGGEAVNNAAIGALPGKKIYNPTQADPSFKPVCNRKLAAGAPQKLGGNVNIKVQAYTRLMALCGQEYVEPMTNEAYISKLVEPCWKFVGPKLGVTAPYSSDVVSKTMMDPAKKAQRTALYEEEDKRFLGCLAGIKVTDNKGVVFRAMNMVGRVSAMDRGDGKKFGYPILQMIYKTAFTGNPPYPGKGWDDKLATANQSVNSWCGIFTLACSKSKPGNQGLSWGIGKVNGRTPTMGNKIDAIQPGDMLHWKGKLAHMSIFYKREGDQIHSVDGNTLYQAISYNVRPLSEVVAWTKLM